MNWELFKPWLTQAARDGLRTAGTALMSYGVIKDGAGLNAFIGAGMTLAGLVWGWWTTGGAQQMAGLLKKLTATATHADAVKAAQVLPPKAAVDTQVKAVAVQSVVNAVVKVLILAFALSAFLAASPAMAAPARKPLAITGNPVKDIQTDFNNAGVNAPTVPSVSGGTLEQCDFNIFAALNPQNVVTQIQNCVSSVNNQFLPDVQAALASAQAYGDDTGTQCLKPALSIVQAAVGSPGVAAVPEVPATATTPAIPAVAAVPAQMPGIILIFQKFREFTLAGGPTACQNWVKTTINGVNPL